jgi:hypothetical protein
MKYTQSDSSCPYVNHGLQRQLKGMAWAIWDARNVWEGPSNSWSKACGQKQLTWNCMCVCSLHAWQVGYTASCCLLRLSRVWTLRPGNLKKAGNASMQPCWFQFSLGCSCISNLRNCSSLAGYSKLKFRLLFPMYFFRYLECHLSAYSY